MSAVFYFPFSKEPTEKRVLTFDFSDVLPVGVSLTTVSSVAVTEATGMDLNPMATLNGAASVVQAGTQVNQAVQAGIDGLDYDYKITCTTSDPNTVLVKAGILKVRYAEDAGAQ